MMIKTLTFSALLLVAPVAGFAMCKDGSHVAISCADGQMWDDEANACIEIVTG